jgi:hypothetical protein
MQEALPVESFVELSCSYLRVKAGGDDLANDEECRQCEKIDCSSTTTIDKKY